MLFFCLEFVHEIFHLLLSSERVSSLQTIFFSKLFCCAGNKLNKLKVETLGTWLCVFLFLLFSLIILFIYLFI